MYCNNNLVCIVQLLLLLSFDTAIHAPDPASVNETEDADKPTQKTSTEDEDPNEEVVNDLDVIAEVKLASTIRKFNSFTITFPSHCC